MFFLNLTPAEFVALFGAVSGFLLALYLLDRSRKRITVSTLRFWEPAARPPESRSRRHIQQPLSLLLQLLAIACLLLAVAQLRFGARETAPRDHVLILDTSAWMGSRGTRGTLIEDARAEARAWLRRLPPGDRVLLIRADALATPATGFEERRGKVEEAIASSVPSATALDIGRAMDLARKVQTLHARREGEIVFAGAGRAAELDKEADHPAPPNLRVLAVGRDMENCGLRAVGLRRSASDAGAWDVFVSARNYGRFPRSVSLGLQFGGAPAGIRRIDLPAGGERSAAFTLRTRAAGWLEARLLTSDGFAGDDRALLELPAQKSLKVTVYSDSPGWLRPVLAANPNVEAVFRTPAQLGAAPDPGIVILDRCQSAVLPATDAIWIQPPEGSSPVQVRARIGSAVLTRWHPEHDLAMGLRVQDLRLDSAEVFSPAPGDISVAEVEQGPVIVARPTRPRMVVLGFHPLRSALRYELAAPLLFANMLRWMEPDVFRRWELNAGTAGSVTVNLDSDVNPARVKVLSEDETPLPFTMKGHTLRFFAGSPGRVRVLAADRELIYSLTLPEVASEKWEPPGGAKRGVPSAAPVTAAPRDAWRVLAILGALLLLVDWVLFGRGRAALSGGRISGHQPAAIPRLRGMLGQWLRKAS